MKMIIISFVGETFVEDGIFREVGRVVFGFYFPSGTFLGTCTENRLLHFGTLYVFCECLNNS